MTPFDRLHPALRHHIVNSLGWDDLRPFQQAVIEPVLAGNHLLILAPTAGGKTEGAFFPVLSRMLTEGWRGLSVLYVCPIKALLNNLDARARRTAAVDRGGGDQARPHRGTRSTDQRPAEPAVRTEGVAARRGQGWLAIPGLDHERTTIVQRGERDH